MSYSVKEIYYTIQGEGAQAGRPAVFVRFAGCNLWSGREEDRSDATCRFCDTDFVGTDGPGGGKYREAIALADQVAVRWPTGEPNRFVVCTGGEPLLQLDELLIDELHERGFAVAVETNGTMHPPKNLDWICVSPKAGAPLVALSGNEMKLVFPQEGILPADLEELAFDHLYLQPMDGPSLQENTRAAIDYCLRHPRWRLSLQTHKFIGIP